MFVSFTPDKRTDHLVSAFVQDQITLLDDRVQLTVGSKFEHNDYTGFEFQPNLRALWKPRPTTQRLGCNLPCRADALAGRR